MTDLEPPRVPADALDRWRLVEDETGRPFSVGPVGVAARTLVYERAARAERVRERPGLDAERPGLDGSCRFFFAGRIRLTPAPTPSPALTRLVAAAAAGSFGEQLGERGFRGVDRVETRDYRAPNGSEGRLVRYEARCAPESESAGDGSPADRAVFEVLGWLAVWPADREFLFAGGTYPVGVREIGSERDAAALADSLDPDTAREELFELVRETER